MSRYIDAKPFDKICIFKVEPGETPVDAVLRMIREAPTADVKPVVRGEWIDDNCSACGQYVYHGDARNYCPNCGAEMKEVEE